MSRIMKMRGGVPCLPDSPEKSPISSQRYDRRNQNKSDIPSAFSSNT